MSEAFADHDRSSSKPGVAQESVMAAGGVIRAGLGAGTLVVLIHRPAYDDWTLPKGKLRKDERLEAGALREVEEETGITCGLLQELGQTSYIDRRGRPKTVTYWEMEPIETRPVVATDEVDEVRWLPLRECLRLLSYERDRVLLSRLETE